MSPKITGLSASLLIVSYHYGLHGNAKGTIKRRNLVDLFLAGTLKRLAERGATNVGYTPR